MPLHAGVHEGGRPKVPKAADYEERADGCHAPPKPLRQVDIARYNASRDEQIERSHVADGVQGLREQLKVLVCALVVTHTESHGRRTVVRPLTYLKQQCLVIKQTCVSSNRDERVTPNDSLH